MKPGGPMAVATCDAPTAPFFSFSDIFRLLRAAEVFVIV
jgi:hypothetical protein